MLIGAATALSGRELTQLRWTHPHFLAVRLGRRPDKQYTVEPSKGADQRPADEKAVAEKELSPLVGRRRCRA